MSTEENYSINAAAKLTRYSIPTIRKRLPALKKAGAVQVEGSWKIPLSALQAVGLMVKVEGDGVSSKDNDPELELLKSELVKLEGLFRADLAASEKRAAVAEAIAHERGEALADMRKAMLMIEGRPPAKRSWFSR